MATGLVGIQEVTEGRASDLDLSRRNLELESAGVSAVVAARSDAIGRPITTE